jgi:hypothetical protein
MSSDVGKSVVRRLPARRCEHFQSAALAFDAASDDEEHGLLDVARNDR